MGRGADNALQVEGILYGELTPRSTTDIHGRLPDSDNLDLTDPVFLETRYFQDTLGFSGTEYWFVATDKLPSGWYDSEDNLNTQGNDFLQSVLDLDTYGILTDSAKYQECQIELTGKTGDVSNGDAPGGQAALGVQHDYLELYAPSRELLAVEQLSDEDGEWRYFDCKNDQSGPIAPAIVYYDEKREEILGAVNCVFRTTS